MLQEQEILDLKHDIRDIEGTVDWLITPNYCFSLKTPPHKKIAFPKFFKNIPDPLNVYWMNTICEFVNKEIQYNTTDIDTLLWGIDVLKSIESKPPNIIRCDAARTLYEVHELFSNQIKDDLQLNA